MVCPTCGLNNDPSAAACARCNTALVAAPAWPPSGHTPAAPPSSPAPGYTPTAPTPGYTPTTPPPGHTPTAPPGYPAPGYAGSSPPGYPAQPGYGEPGPGYLAPGFGSPGQPVPGQPVSGQPVPGQPVAGEPVPGYPAPGYPAPGYPAPGYPAPPSAPPAYGRPPRNWLPLVAGISVIVLLALVAGLVVYRNGQDDPVAGPAPATQPTTAPATTTGTTDSATTPPTTTGGDPLPQARVVDDVLVRSKASRDKLNSAIDRVGRCTGVSGALSDMRRVGDERRAQIEEVQGADLSAVTNGESIRSTLVTALQHSLDADAAFVEWAEAAVNGGCADTASRKAAYDRGLAESEQAGTSKVAFLAVWNPVAGQLGLPTRTRQGI
ncbi:hypothetical protein [Paractinoplanes atraurantiacus]|uniref:Uncharacterized protein n=1 Tax=Paractinoplanes atraurantiacus TaxID=1036182 RepID=A0A285IKC5_9ACTN|nr:hypothetical protein [Actinoplanes atraurantiacus]SNY47441.1 hypothetical protein SAMN05421748_108138 [Actinoplanes atraurantiacus]